MSNPISILLVEDSVNDCDLLLEHLREHGYAPIYRRVESEKEMEQVIDEGRFDVVLCDHNMPIFDVYSAISIAKRRIPMAPFIVVSGTVSEGIAVRTLKAGAKDYVLKNNLSRLIPAIQRELLEVSTHAVHLRVEAELKKKELELRQAQKLEAVGMLAGGIAHDFNNILSVILMQAEGSMENLDERPDLKSKTEHLYRSFEQIRKAGNRAANLTRQLLAFSRKQVIQPKVVDINELVRDMENMLSRVIEENISLELELDVSCKNIKVDPGQFEQIIMNLVVNSRDALTNGGRIKITTANAVVSGERAHRDGVAPGAYALLQVIDSGSGMSEETQKQMFDPFFTTKGIGRGTGLGLSTVYGIVKQNRGLIIVESKVNQGTVIKIFFPHCEGEVQLAAPKTAQMKDLRGSETILVVEDESDLRELVCETLKSCGYTVLEAKNGLEAMEQFRTSAAPIQLVITDVVMPKMGGRELSEKVWVTNLEAKFLFLSGYTEDVLIQQGIDSGLSYFLEKPFAMKALLGKIRNILEQGV